MDNNKKHVISGIPNPFLYRQLNEDVFLGITVCWGWGEVAFHSKPGIESAKPVALVTPVVRNRARDEDVGPESIPLV